jgi:hypothetical protein
MIWGASSLVRVITFVVEASGGLGSLNEDDFFDGAVRELKAEASIELSDAAFTSCPLDCLRFKKGSRIDNNWSFHLIVLSVVG